MQNSPSKLYLHGIGHFHPENVISNKFLEDLDIGTSEEWILERVGIHTRRTVLPLDYIRETKNRDSREAPGAALYTNAQTAAAAARMALERSGLKLEDIGLIVSGSSVPDYASPAEATTVAAELGIEVPCFDLNSACTSFGMQVNFLWMMKPESLPPYVLMVNPDNITRVVDYSDRSAAVLWGDGGVATIVSTTVPSNKAFVKCSYDSRPSSWDKVVVARMGYFHQEGNAVQGFAIRKTTDCLRELQESFSMDPRELKFIGHQANLGMLRTVCERCGIEERNHWHNVADFGNTGCAGASAVLSQHWDDLVPGAYVAMAMVGSGFTWVYMMLEVGENGQR